MAHVAAEVGSRAVRLAGRPRSERATGEPIGAAAVRSGEA